jgi:Flp pilus assembly protein TadD
LHWPLPLGGAVSIRKINAEGLVDYRIGQGLVGLVVLGALVVFTAFPQLKPDWIQIGSGRKGRAASALLSAAGFKANSADARLTRAAERILDEDWEAAAHELNEVIRLQPKNAEAYYLRGIVYQELEEWDEALKDLNAVLKLTPDDPDALYVRAEVLAETGDEKAAIADLDKVLKLEPNSPDALGLRGTLRENAGEFAAALADYRKALKIDDEDPYALNSLAWLLATAPDAKIRNGQEAQKLAMRAVELDGGQDWDTLDTLAAACAENGNFVGALRCQNDALKFAPPEVRQELQERLELYQAKQPYRLPIP